MSKYIGYRGITKEGYAFEVVAKGSKIGYLVVRFENGYQVNAYITNIKRGEIKNPYHPSVCGVGYIGVGDFRPNIGVKNSKEYSTWKNMLRRCYDQSFQEKSPNYIGCSVAPEWHNFQNFAGWVTDHKNWNKGYQLDKDLKIIDNKIYSPETCTLIPSQINSLLLDNANGRGDFAIGVCWDKSNKKYIASCNLFNVGGQRGKKKLGYFETEQEAFFAYKKAKEENVKFVANLHKDEICIDIYNNLLNWEVTIPEFSS